MLEKTQLFKEEIDNIKVPTEKLDSIISKLETNTPNKKSSVRKKFLYSVGAASITFGLLWGSSALSPTMANTLSNIPLIGSVFNVFGDSGLKKVSNNGTSKQLGASETVNNKTVTLQV
ncbi:DUF4179 domain-containing protein [Bacillus sp. 1P06AnD]|uniref:DUF4179 domain-containing protein n=1 Tax=Bacillus sp. 1P06AnD TaxID=3132208 RepID=UPI00399F5EFD